MVFRAESLRRSKRRVQVLRILLVSDYSTRTGGVEVYVSQLREQLRGAGHDVVFLSSSAGSRELRVADLECWGTSQRHISRLLQTFNPISLAKLRQTIQRFKPDVVHLNLFLTQLSPSVFLALEDVPVIHTAHLYRMVCPLGHKLLPDGRPCRDPVGDACLKNGCLPKSRWWLDMLQRKILFKYFHIMDAIWANSETTARFLRGAGIPVARVQSPFLGQRGMAEHLQGYQKLASLPTATLRKQRRSRQLALGNNINAEEGHLGGYIRGSSQPAPSGLRVDNGDPATFSPSLWNWAVNELKIHSVLDVGCGEGHSTRYFRDLGCRTVGVDGSPQAFRDSRAPECHHLHDFVDGPFLLKDGFDLVWSCEFVEHVEERYLSHILETFAQSIRYLMLTYADVGQPGWHHVNCQDREYWIKALKSIGFQWNEELTRRSREVAKDGHYGQRGLFFGR
jgi:SAM-dependent methyltransferase